MSTLIHPTTKEVNKHQKELSKNAKLEALKWLADTFPEAFNTESRVRPLKKGIMDDILDYLDNNPEPEFSRSKLREAVVMFTRRMEYLVCLKCRNNRIDLQGNYASEVTVEESEMAAEKIKAFMQGSIDKPGRTGQARRAPRKASFDNANLMPKKITGETPSFGDNSTLVAATSSSGVPKGVQTQVTIKRKIAKRIDPEAVARMKEKLGISKKETA